MAKAKDATFEVLDNVKVELLEVKNGTNTIYHKLGNTTFVDGVADVSAEVATVLKELGLVK